MNLEKGARRGTSNSKRVAKGVVLTFVNTGTTTLASLKVIYLLPGNAGCGFLGNRLGISPLRANART